MNRYTIKRTILKYSGILESRWRQLNPGLYIFNYHRIGDYRETEFDPNIYSCDAEQFASQLAFIRSRFRMIDVETLLQMQSDARHLDEPAAMITFDDGYEDNFVTAAPILKQQGVTGLFFLPTDFIGNGLVPWWEEVAWIIRNSSLPSVKLSDWQDAVAIDRNDIGLSIRNVLRQFKDQKSRSLDEKLEELQTLCNLKLDTNGSVRLFMSWEQARLLREQGMHIGSHSCSHRILSHLSLNEQAIELQQSKSIIEEKTGGPVVTVAYPVGGVDTYTTDTQKVIADCGYRLAFTFPIGGGYNHNPLQNPFALARMSTEAFFGAADIKYSSVFAPRY